MKTAFRLTAALVATLALLALQAPVAAQGLRLPPVTRTTLPNGITVVLMEYHRAPTLTVIADFAGGTSVEPPAKAGVAGLAARLMRRGTHTRTAAQIAEEIDFLGGTLQLGADLDRISAALSVQSRDTDAGLDLLADVLRRPAFPADELERARKLTLAQLETLSEDPATLARRVSNEVAYGGHPYGIKPTLASIRAIGPQDLAAYYQRCVVPERMILVAVGDFKTRDLLAALEKRFADWPRSGSTLPAVPEAPPASRRVVVVDNPEATQTQVRLIRVALPRTTPDHAPALVANAILGGGFTSRLTDEIRVNRSLTYGIDSSFAMQLHGGTFGVSTFTKVASTGAMVDAVEALLRDTARKGFTEAELQKVKGYLAGLFAIRLQTPDELASQLADVAFYHLPDDYLDTYLARLRAVTLADANRIARTWFDPASLSLILVAPAAKVEAAVKGRGPVERREAASVGR